MQILLQALLAETNEGKKPVLENLLGTENEPALFAEVFDLADDQVDVLDLETELIDLEDQPVEAAPVLAVAVKDSDIILPELERRAPKPVPILIELANVEPDGTERGVQITSRDIETPIEARKTIEAQAPDSSKTSEVALDEVALDKAAPLQSSIAPNEKIKSVEAAESNVEQAADKAEQQTKSANSNEPLALSSEVVDRRSKTFAASGALAEGDQVDLPFAPERHSPREVPLATSKPPALEVVPQKPHGPSAGETTAKAEPVEVKAPQVSSVVAPQPSTAAQSSMIAAPLIQNVFQPEKISNRDAALSLENPVVAAAATDSEKLRSIPNASRPDQAARPIVSQVVQLAFRAAADGIVEVRLQPEELGRLRIAMTQVESGVVVQISAERPETLDLLRRNVDLLERDLREQGFGNASFSFGEESSNAPEDDSEGPGFGQTSKPNTRIDVDVLPERNVVNDGRLDIRL